MAVPHGGRLSVAPVVRARALLIRVPLGLPTVCSGRGGRDLLSKLATGEKVDSQMLEQQQGVKDEILPDSFHRVMQGWPPVDGELARGLGIRAER